MPLDSLGRRSNKAKIEPSQIHSREMVVIDPPLPSGSSASCPVVLQPRPCATIDLVHMSTAKVEVRLRKRAELYPLGDEIGNGSFGEVFRSTRDGVPVAVKRFRTDVVAPAVEESYTLERCAEHKHIIRLLDVFALRSGPCLVFELWGRDLEQAFESSGSGFEPGMIRTIAEQVLLALAFLHDTLRLIHTDIKPQNCLVAQTAPGSVHIKVADLGSCVVSDPSRRADTAPGFLRSGASTTGRLLITTLPYRAPELVFGDSGFGPAIDLWSLGVMVARFAGLRFTPDDDESVTSLVAAWFRTLGYPTGPDLSALRAMSCFPLTPPADQGASIEFDDLCPVLGVSGVSLVKGWLSWRGVSRPAAQPSLASSLFRPTLLALAQPPEGGNYADVPTSAFSGVRHLWNVATGDLAPEVLQYLRHDPAFAPGFEPVRRVFTQTDFPVHSRYAQQKLPGGATKYTISGRLTRSALDRELNARSVSEDFPFASVVAWRTAFLRVNEGALRSFQDSLRKRLRALSGELGEFGKVLLAKDCESWLLAVAEAHITHRPVGSAPAAGAAGSSLFAGPPHFSEALHNDGSASAVHLGLTLAGEREVRFLQEPVSETTRKSPVDTIAPDVRLASRPGSVYIGGVTGARHQVQHGDVRLSDLLEFPPGPCSVTVMFRSCVFADSGRRMNTTPHPRSVWTCFHTCVRTFLGSGLLRLPTLGEIEGSTRDAV